MKNCLSFLRGRNNRVNIEPPSAYNPNFNRQTNNELYEGIEPDIEIPTGRQNHLFYPTYTSEVELLEDIRNIRAEIQNLQNQERRELNIAIENQDMAEERRIRSYYNDLNIQNQQQLEDLIGNLNILQTWESQIDAVQYQGEGLKRHTKKHYNANRWIKHVKAYAKKHSVPYNVALTKAKTSYK
jgi:hypothetical protein